MIKPILKRYQAQNCEGCPLKSQCHKSKTNPFRNTLVHIFNTAGKRKLNLNISYDDFKLSIQNEVELATKIVDTVNKASNDKENLICYDECNQEIPFLLVSKQDGNITNETIRMRRKELGMTQEQVAAGLGVSTSAVHKWENRFQKKFLKESQY